MTTINSQVDISNDSKVTNVAIKRPAEEDSSSEHRDNKKGKTDAEQSGEAFLDSLHFNKIKPLPTDSIPPPSYEPSALETRYASTSTSTSSSRPTRNHHLPSGPSSAPYNRDHRGNGNSRHAEPDSDFDMNVRRRAILSKFNAAKGFGFVRPRDLNSQSVMIHLKNLLNPADRDLREGDEVEFSIESTQKGLSGLEISRVTVRDEHDQFEQQNHSFQRQPRHHTPQYHHQQHQQQQPPQHHQQPHQHHQQQYNYNYSDNHSNSYPAHPSSSRDQYQDYPPPPPQHQQHAPPNNYGYGESSNGGQAGVDPNPKPYDVAGAAQYYAAYAAQLAAYAAQNPDQPAASSQYAPYGATPSTDPAAQYAASYQYPPSQQQSARGGPPTSLTSPSTNYSPQYPTIPPTAATAIIGPVAPSTSSQYSPQHPSPIVVAAQYPTPILPPVVPQSGSGSQSQSQSQDVNSNSRWPARNLSRSNNGGAEPFYGNGNTYNQRGGSASGGGGGGGRSAGGEGRPPYDDRSQSQPQYNQPSSSHHHQQQQQYSQPPPLQYAQQQPPYANQQYGYGPPPVPAQAQAQNGSGIPPWERNGDGYAPNGNGRGPIRGGTGDAPYAKNGGGGGGGRSGW